jgi:hypothetical protein
MGGQSKEFQTCGGRGNEAVAGPRDVEVLPLIRLTSLPASRPEQGTFLRGGGKVSRQPVPWSWQHTAGQGEAEGREERRKKQGS